MVIDIIDGKIAVPPAWKKEKRLKMRKEKDSYVLTIEDDTPEGLKDENVELEDYKGDDGYWHHVIRFKKGLSGEALQYFQEKLKNA